MTDQNKTLREKFTAVYPKIEGWLSQQTYRGTIQSCTRLDRLVDELVSADYSLDPVTPAGYNILVNIFQWFSGTQGLEIRIRFDNLGIARFYVKPVK